MRELIGILIITFLLFGCTENFPVSDGLQKFKDSNTNLFGFKNLEGEIVIKPTYSLAENFENGYTIVKVQNKLGVIDTLGKIIIPIKFNSLTACNLNAISDFGRLKNHREYFCYENGIVIPEGYLTYWENNKIGLRNFEYKEIIPTVYDGLVWLNRKYLLAKSNELDENEYNVWSVINFSNEKIIDNSFFTVKSIENDFVILEKRVDSKIRYFAYDLSNQKYLASGTRFERKENLYFFYDSDYSSILYPKTVISKTRKILENTDNLQLTDYSEGYFSFYEFDKEKNMPKYGFRDVYGKKVIKPVYDSVQQFQKGLAKVYLSNKSFYINEEGICIKDCPTEKWLSFHQVSNTKINNEERFKEHLNKGFEKVNQSNYQGSIEDFTKATKENSSDYEGYYNNALSKLLTKKLNDALVDINEAIRLNPNFADSYYVKGNILQRKNMFSKAISSYLKTIEINPNHTDATLKCAIVYGKSGNKTMSCVYLKKACELGSSKGCEGYNQFCN